MVAMLTISKPRRTGYRLLKRFAFYGDCDRSDREYECAWSPQLRPIGEGTFDRETFDQWWRKAKPFIPHLHPQIAEQWIYKHWTNSPYCYLPLQNLEWRCEEWKTEAIFKEIFVRPSFGPNHLSRILSFSPIETALGASRGKRSDQQAPGIIPLS